MTHCPSPALWPYLLWLYLLWLYLLGRTVPAQLGSLIVVAELEVVLYPRDAPIGLRIIRVLVVSASLLVRGRVRVRDRARGRARGRVKVRGRVEVRVKVGARSG